MKPMPSTRYVAPFVSIVVLGAYGCAVPEGGTDTNDPASGVSAEEAPEAPVETRAATSCRRLPASVVAKIPRARTGVAAPLGLTAGAVPADCPPREIQCNMDLVATCERNFGTVECDTTGCTCHVC